MVSLSIIQISFIHRIPIVYTNNKPYSSFRFIEKKKHFAGKYARSFGCNMSEAEEENLENYANLGQFFRRKLKVNKINENKIFLKKTSNFKVMFVC